MATLATVRTNTKILLGRNYTGIDTPVDFAINSVCELLGRNIPAIYDEEQWEHTFNSGDTANNTDNFALPPNTNFIRTATLIDTTGDEYTYKNLVVLSPDDAYDTDKLEGRRGSSIGFFTDSREMPTDYTLSDFRSGFANVTRTNRSGEPMFVYRVAKNVYVHPRSSEDIEGWILRLLLQMFPAELTTDGATNSVTVNYPHALAHMAAGIMWNSVLSDQQRAQAEFTIGAQFLGSIATNDQISKLIGTAFRMANG